ncbi:Alpha-L-rhamnosidase N-terminal domain-containing protein [Chitinophaga sp. CF118]|uniref:family 78 glycoside hydrolase catalytic domain n=1 Tax=Chitinophaga sp. CF118 TaxID=1884367 RepID=UPI0008E1F983|nr:family 78 glycoside hydrolase catalytic domain [Chitinophaga sp. CF118]SFE16776.1 Alpha-L-rhamnosidase N-terminal domain-containing protein [Chitinophaga sp. CF118]
MIRIFLSTLFVLLSCFCIAQKIKTEVTNLLCEHKVSPNGVNASAPSFSWQIVTTQRGYLQSAYQLQIADDSALLSKQTAGIIKSTQPVHTGKKLLPAHRYYWRVQVWDQQNHASGWSDVTSFTTGLFTPADWSNAKWIGYEELPDSMIQVPGVHSGEDKKSNKAKQRPVVPLFRKIFKTDRAVKSALVFMSGLGQYELTINGNRAGDNFLAPGWTFYDKRVLYNTYDVTDLLNKGNNVIGVIVGNGFYNINKERYRKLSIAFGMPKMICKLLITYNDGTTATIVSGSDWKTAPSPITFASIYGGEDYNATLEQKDWDQPSFQDTAWENALLVKAPKGLLEAEKDYPVKVTDILHVKSVSRPVDSIYMYDFGQNASGIVELKVKGHKGQTIKLTPAELINDQKLANQKATGKPYYFSYTLKGDGVETWRPRFTYYGFRYVQVQGAVPDTATNPEGLPQITALDFLHTRNSTPSAGTFECSNALFNQINELILWAIKSNIQSVMTDCPHREKLSWLEQDYLMGASIQHNFDIYQLYKKLVYDMMDAQTKEGLIPDIAPEFVFFDDKGFGFRDSPEWGSASVILPWLIYKWYGDKEVMRTAYPMMKKYVEYLQSRAEGNILSYGLGDWFDYGPARPGVAQLTPKSLTATAIYYYDINLLSQMAALLNNKQDAVKWTQLAAVVKDTFNNQFFNAQSKVYATGSQTAMAMPLCTGLVDEKYRKEVFKNLVDSITHDGKKLTAGDIGFHFLIEALQEGGASQLIYDMNYRSDVPGYGFQLAKGATALTESWPALENVSNNHLMLGHIMEWFYNGLAGINQSAESVAYKDIIIRPEVVGDISYVKGSYNAQYGTIRSEWKKEGGVFYLYVQIPANTTATIYLPAKATQSVKESDLPLARQKDVKLLGYKDGKAMIRTGSGEYHFVVK